MAIAATPELLRWDPLTPQQVAELMRDAPLPWWIAGGWALDLFMGRQTRAHEDIDIAVFRDDGAALRRHLAAWELFIAENGTLRPLAPGAPLASTAHELWCRERGHETWQLEVLVEERRADRWAYRRDARIGAHWKDIGRVNADGLPYIRPDIQLLYKSKRPRPSDETDFLTVLPSLDAAQRGYLAGALWLIEPDHRWLQRLK